MDIILYDIKEARENLLPITFTRSIADIRLGILTLKEKWEKYLGATCYIETVDYLQPKYDNGVIPKDAIRIPSNVIPTEAVAKKVLAGDLNFEQDEKLFWLYDIFLKNHKALEQDFELLTRGRESQPIDPSNTVIGSPSKIFIEEGAEVTGAFLNVKEGPIYIGKDAVVMEAAALRGPIALCEHAQAKLGCKIYGATTLGPYCKVGGELANVVMIGYSNKGHDGFLGNAVIGEWCNLGGGTTASNLKNDYSEIKLWNYPAHRFLRTGLQFCGLIMGDHSKAGINTMFNTATVVGVGVNIYGSGFPRPFVASFSEGGAAGITDVSLTKFFDIARRVMARRHKELTDTDIEIFHKINEIADRYK